MPVTDSEVISGLGAIILCGGKSERMGMRKEWLTLGNETLLERLVKIVSTVADPIIIATGTTSPVPPLPPIATVVRDKLADRGPLAGMQSGFGAIPPACNRAFVVSCDTPLITPHAIRQLDQQLKDAVGVVPVISDVAQPLCGIYLRQVIPYLDQLLANPRNGPRHLADLVPIKQWKPELPSSGEASISPFQSFNTPQEWDKIRMSFDR